MKLNVKAFTIACGLVWGLGLCALTWWIIAFDGSSNLPLHPLSSIYRGYVISPIGSLIGLAYGLVDGAIGGLVFSWLYNCICCKCKCKEEGTATS